MQGQWTFICRAMPDVSPLFLRLEEAIRMTFLPALLRRQVNDLEREVLSMPARMGGLGICKPQVLCVDAHENSKKLSAPLIRLILRQELDLDPAEITSEVKHLRMQTDENTETPEIEVRNLLAEAPHSLQCAMKMTVEKGASSNLHAVWLASTRPSH